jgi:hypothetical protein
MGGDGREGTTTLYRAAAEAECRGYWDTVRAGPGWMGNKLFAESASNAGSWGRAFFKADKQPQLVPAAAEVRSTARPSRASTSPKNACAAPHREGAARS